MYNSTVKLCLENLEIQEIAVPKGKGFLMNIQKRREKAKEFVMSSAFQAKLKKALNCREKFAKKSFFVKGYFNQSAIPVHAENRIHVLNSNIITDNSHKFAESSSSQSIKDFLFSPEADRFDIEEQSKSFVTSLLKDTQPLDMVDLSVSIRACTKAFRPILLDASNTVINSAKFTERFKEFRQGVFKELVQTIPPNNILGEGEFSIKEVFEEILCQGDSATEYEKGEILKVQSSVRDRIIIHKLILEKGLNTSKGRHGESPYSVPLSQHELDSMNNKAANVLERLHLLKAYRVTSFVVPASTVQLPWDIAVVPPLDSNKLDASGKQTGGYAEGAVVDFMLLPSDPNRSNILFRYEKKSESITSISVGDTEAYMRFRLHDNGQISHGLYYNNIPSDVTERAFIESYGGFAFQRLRGLFINLAFDALVPDDVVSSRDVGSVAKTLKERPNEPVERVISDLLLRRQRSLERAGVNERQRRPQGWKAPQSEGEPNVSGYIKRLPEGTHARSTAEEEARAYYRSINVHFDGLPEGYTFANPYYQDRGKLLIAVRVFEKMHIQLDF